MGAHHQQRDATVQHFLDLREASTDRSRAHAGTHHFAVAQRVNVEVPCQPSRLKPWALYLLLLLPEGAEVLHDELCATCMLSLLQVANISCKNAAMPGEQAGKG